ncbi:DASH complex subunit DAD3 [[Candida] zeylanoides]
MPPKDIYELNYSNSALLSPTEAQILSQYQLLATQLNALSAEIRHLNSSHKADASGANADDLLDSMRNLEVKIGLVYTLFKGAVYSLFLQHEEDLNLQNDIEQQREKNVSSQGASEEEAGNEQTQSQI